MSRAASAARGHAVGVPAPADRRYRRSSIRPSRHGRWYVIWRRGRWVLAAAVVAAVAVWSGQAVLGSAWLRVSRVSVHGNVRLSAGEVETLVNGMRGENILQVDFDRYRRRLLDSPWVADATLWRLLPSTIEVRVTERHPVAIARLGSQLFLVDGSGVVIDAYGAQYRDFDLPIVDGLVSSPPDGAGPTADADRAQLTASVLTSFDARPDLRRRLSQVDVSDAHDAVVMFDNDPAWLHLGDAKFLERVQMYLELGPALHERFQHIDSVDLRFDERIYVRGERVSGTVAARVQ